MIMLSGLIWLWKTRGCVPTIVLRTHSNTAVAQHWWSLLAITTVFVWNTRILDCDEACEQMLSICLNLQTLVSTLQISKDNLFSRCLSCSSQGTKGVLPRHNHPISSAAIDSWFNYLSFSLPTELFDTRFILMPPPQNVLIRAHKIQWLPWYFGLWFVLWSSMKSSNSLIFYVFKSLKK